MDLEQIRAHWRNWAQQYGTDLRATTKGTTAKIMELDTLSRAMDKITAELGMQLNILEAGCGNGRNLLSLTQKLPQAQLSGFDLIPEMIDAANELKFKQENAQSRLNFFVGDVLKIDLPAESYDVVFTDRCLINLNTDDLQQQAIGYLSNLVKTCGYLLMIENSQQSYKRQNLAREAVGLQARTPDVFNHFFDEEKLLPFLPAVGLELIETEDFISLHDLVLYVLVPMINGGEIDYAHPMVEAATQLNTALSKIESSSVGVWGQNRLYLCRKIC